MLVAGSWIAPRFSRRVLALETTVSMKSTVSWVNCEKWLLRFRGGLKSHGTFWSAPNPTKFQPRSDQHHDIRFRDDTGLGVRWTSTVRDLSLRLSMPKGRAVAGCTTMKPVGSSDVIQMGVALSGQYLRQYSQRPQNSRRCSNLTWFPRKRRGSRTNYWMPRGRICLIRRRRVTAA